jgi:class 3 adenylate cyclase
MKKYICFLICIISFQLNANEIAPIIIEKIEEFIIGKELYLYEDKTHQETIETIKTKISEFKKSDKEIPNFGYSSSTFWVYFKIKNPTNQNQQILIELYYTLLDEIDYYLLDSGKIIKTVQTGDLRNFYAREIPHRNFLFPLSFDPQQEYEIFFKIKSQGSLQIPLRIISYQTFIQKEHIEQYAQGIYYGIMIAMIFYNFFLLLSIKDISYLYYILYIIGVMFFSLMSSGYGFEFLYPNYPKFGNSIMLFMTGFFFTFAGIFSAHFLKLKELTPLLYILLFGVTFIYFLAMPLSFLLKYNVLFRIVAYFALPFTIITLLGGILSYKKGWKPARFYVLGWTTLLVGMFVFALELLGKLPSNFFTTHSVQIGSALEVILLSLGLADRINVLKQEKEKAQTELLNTKIIMLDSFSRFVPKHFANILQKESILDVKPGDATEKDLAILFNDIKNFSTLAEMMSVKETFEFLNIYFEIMSPIILKYRGFIDKFIGDEIMALFDCNPDFPLDAAIEMRLRLKEFNEKIKHLNLPTVDMGVGINYGKVILGTIGSKERLDTTVIGDTVNTAERIQQLTRTFKTPILLTENIKNNLQQTEKYYLRRLQKVRVKGKLEPVQIYECFNVDPDEQIEKKLQTLDKYEEAIHLMHNKNFTDAILLFKEINSINPNDFVVKIYLEKLESQINPS